MKKIIIFSFFFLLAGTRFAFSQKPVQVSKVPVTKGKQPLPVVSTGQTVLAANNPAEKEAWVEVYELPGYQGRMQRFTGSVSGSPLALPFSPDRISIKRAKNTVLRIVMTEMTGYIRHEIKEDVPDIRINNGGINGFSFEWLPYAEVFEFPDFRGRSVKFTEAVEFRENLGLPFPLSRISVRLSDENTRVSFSLNCGAAKGYTVIDKSQRLVTQTTAVCGIRVERKLAVRMRFNGIVTDIHNNDCRRMYGTVKIRLLERDRNGMIRTVCRSADPSRQDAEGWITVYNRESGAEGADPQVYDLQRYNVYHPESGFRLQPDQSKKSWLFRQPLDGDRPYELIYFDSLSLYTGELRMEVKARIGSHHKGCDLCTDYTAGASMTEERVQEYVVRSFRQGGGRIQAGNYRVSGGAGAFTGPAHNTFLDFTYTEVGYGYAVSRALRP